MQGISATDRDSDSTPIPRARCIIEFIEGDVSQPPVIYPLGGSDKIDAAMSDAILEKWGVRGRKGNEHK